jgi:hypothetical protein
VKNVSFNTALASIRKYWTNDVATPYIVAVDDNESYKQLVSGLGTVSQMRVSAYCGNDDAYPDIDALCAELAAITQIRFCLVLGNMFR